MLKKSKEKNSKDMVQMLENVGKATTYIYSVLILIAIGLVIALFVLFR